MANIVLTDCKIYQGAADLTGQSNKVQAQATVNTLTSTTFASGGSAEHKGGLKSAKIATLGFYDAGNAGLPDDRAFTDLGVTGVPQTIIPTAGTTAGDLAYLTRIIETDYTVFGQVGELIPFSLTSVSDVPLVRGQVLNPAGTARTATGSGTAVQIGAVAAGQKIWAALHVFTIAGTGSPTLTLRLQSAPASNFAAPTTQATFTAVTAIGGQFTSVAGAVTDTWWRADWTISGTTPSFLFALVAGVSAP